MKASTPWITYRTRFLVKAKQLTASLTFTDVLGRHHSGHKGDYLVESSDGVLRIAPRQIFEDIYVVFAPDETLKQRSNEILSFRAEQHYSRSERCCGVEEPAVLLAPQTGPGETATYTQTSPRTTVEERRFGAAQAIQL